MEEAAEEVGEKFCTCARKGVGLEESLTTRKFWPGDEGSWSPSQPLEKCPSVLNHWLRATHGTCGLHVNVVVGPGGGIWGDSQLCSHSRSSEWHTGCGKGRLTVMNT